MLLPFIFQFKGGFPLFVLFGFSFMRCPCVRWGRFLLAYPFQIPSFLLAHGFCVLAFAYCIQTKSQQIATEIGELQAFYVNLLTQLTRIST
jgi:hypothetical protein